MVRRFPIFVLGLMSLINLGRGSIHAFAPDGGAASIAGLSLGSSGPTIVSLFAVLGLNQIVMGVFQAYVLIWRRNLVVLFLALQLTTTAMAMINLYAWRPLPVTVPGQPFNLVLLVLQALAFMVAIGTLRSRGRV